jgi:hypothetical protein
MNKYVIKETKETCVILETFKNLFGEDMCRVKTESGQISEVPKEEIVNFLQD